jgi:hypothetical protein
MRLRSADGLRDTLSARLTRQPWSVLLPFVLLQWLLLLLLTRRIVHNGWLFSQDASTYFYSTAWSLAHGQLPPALVGYGWPLLTAPIAGIAGVDFLDGLPALVLLQTLVLLPIALLTVYGVATLIGGRLLGYLTAASWVLVPYVVHPLFASGYHATYVEQLLPQSLGLTGLGDFPAMVFVLVAAYFAVSSIDTADPMHAALGGLFAGFAIAVDPGNVLFLAAPVVGFALARRWSTALVFGLALLPAVATVTLWQYRGLGHVPHIHAQVDLHQLQLLRLDFRSVFYSDRLVEVLFIAGALALGRRSWAKSAFVSAWFLSYLLVRGSAPGTSIGANTWFGAFMPAFPAFVIACCSIPLLVPRLGHRLGDAPAVQRPSPLHWRDQRVVVAGIVLAALPILVVAALPVQKKPKLVAYPDEHALVPVDKSFQPQASAGPGAVALTWPAKHSDGAASFYTVFRSPANGSGGIACDDAHGAARCVLAMQRLASSIDASYLDFNPEVPSGRWTYRIGLAANWHADPSAGGVMLLSPPVDVTVP